MAEYFFPPVLKMFSSNIVGFARFGEYREKCVRGVQGKKIIECKQNLYSFQRRTKCYLHRVKSSSVLLIFTLADLLRDFL